MPTFSPGDLASGHHGELWELRLPQLPAGTYSVFWTSESATDGHVMSSFYTFRIAPSGGAASFGAVTGAAAGVYGGGTGSGSGVALSGSVAATTIFSWLGLMAQALWLGALVIELAVLAPARRAVTTSAARLAWAAAPRLWWLARAAPVVAVWALVGEVLSLAVQGTGGDWGRALAPATLGGILSSQNGRFILLRCAVLLAALLLTGRVRAPAVATTSAPTPEKVRLEREMGRLQALVRAAQRTMGLPPPPSREKAKGDKRRRRRPQVRAVKAMALLRASEPAPTPEAPEASR